ncbi:putative 1-acylglycerol-3-phosphate acyltransferase [Piedraia hortae CBS 480.64]|uniref:1-acyl-sn-glycerol-3-phosphate acyltransferase n=1 Tax=Piedraia hortae CBS 480.64 TaxID=1314780 RepID=A0A6A7BW62_9PEZI|nr:putative 1-acylglycerol-3-phosphate acyltransferase [Piedraia hortae CBS 480.64]
MDWYWAPIAIALLAITVTMLIWSGKALSLPALEYYGRMLASAFALTASAVIGIIASICLSFSGQRALGQWAGARAFKWTMWYVTGIEFVVSDPGNYHSIRPAVFVANHQSELDVLLLGYTFPKHCSMMAKSSLKYVPFLGWFMLLSKAVFIQRKSHTKALAAFAGAAEQMHTNKQSVFLFPEGTRSYSPSPTLLPFKKGAFHLAVQAQVPIVPVVAANYSHLFNTKKKTFKPGKVETKVLEPIQTKGLTKDDVNKLLNETREKMLEALISLS